MQPIFDTISALIDQFCRTHLKDEYSMVYRVLAAALCRKRPSPLVKGKPEQWACACDGTYEIVEMTSDRPRGVTACNA